MINGVTQIWPKIDPPSPLCHIKMTVLLTSFYWVSHNSTPPSPYSHDIIYECSIKSGNRIGRCWMFWPAFGCCTLQMLFQICFFNIYWAKKLKKEEKVKKFLKNFAKKFFEFEPERWLRFSFLEKKMLTVVKACFLDTKKCKKNIRIHCFHHWKGVFFWE